MRVICAAVLLWASILALPAAQTLDGMWEGKMESGPGASWRVDFDGQLWSLNGGPPLPLTLVPSDDPATVQFDVSVGGNTLRYTGKRDGSRIAGTIAKINLTLTRLPDDTPRFAARKRAPFPARDHAMPRPSRRREPSSRSWSGPRRFQACRSPSPARARSCGARALVWPTSSQVCP